MICDPETQREDSIMEFLREGCRSKLRGRYFDVTSEKGRREYAEWLSREISDIELFLHQKEMKKEFMP